MTLELTQDQTGPELRSQGSDGSSKNTEPLTTHSNDDRTPDVGSDFSNEEEDQVHVREINEKSTPSGRIYEEIAEKSVGEKENVVTFSRADAGQNGDPANSNTSTDADSGREGDAKPCDKDGYRSSCFADPKNLPLIAVRDIAIERLDAYGNLIVQIFNKRPCYAIYVGRDKNNKESVHVHLSDNQDRADEQIDRLIELNCLRAKLEYLTAGLKARNYYNKQTAVALQAALERESCDQAKTHLQLLVKNATEERACLGRQFYMISAGVVAAVLASILMGIGGNLTGGATQTGMLLLSSGAGALGAVLSIFIALRNRTVAPDQDWKTNIIDGAARIGIGVISAFALHLLLTSDFLSNSIASGLSLPGKGAGEAVSGIAWKSALLIGFAGGFLERLVPDLLEKSHPPATPSEKAKTTDPL